MSYVKEVIQNILGKKEIKEDENLYYSFLVAREGSEYYAVSIEYLVEVSEANIQNMVNIPLVDEWILGLLNVRGNIIPVISLSKILNLSSSREGIKYAIIVEKNFPVAFGVEEIKDLYQVSSKALKPIFHLQENKVLNIISYEFDMEEKQVASVVDIEALYDSDFMK
ncbi:chemotaxis protein CheW [Thermospira aquatica]|uniref:Chemotaxis protein CheW n=1 Tax=Thermospira aquatica TaxID=2828656 RepID=A0AAX3BCY1_9SPIR|nr:chemotaxis protein CheW [Thermospira aquatica]URA10148.1 chemotaxis protein CheW [Thermospira aquatica]